MRKLIVGLLLVLLAAAAVIAWRNWREHRYDAVIWTAARRYGVDPSLIKAVIWRESASNASVRGRVGEIGLMQVGRLAAQEWATAEHVSDFHHEHAFDPGTNTLIGAWYLRKLSGRYTNTDNPAAFALADYNAGRANVLRWAHDAAATNGTAFLSAMDFPGTQRYVRAILGQWRVYRVHAPAEWAAVKGRAGEVNRP